MSNDGNDDDVCIACNIALKNGDKFYFDVDGGYLHAACTGPEREGYVGADGEPLKDGDPIPEPKTWVDPPPSSPVAGGGEERERLIEWLNTLPDDAGCDELLVPVDDLRALRRALLSSPRVEEVRREAWRVGMRNAARICVQFDRAKNAAREIVALADSDAVADINLRALSPPQGE